MAAEPIVSATAASFRRPIPPPCFDYRAALLAYARRRLRALVRVPRRRFGPVPAWRPPDFLGTSHLSPESVADVEVERVLRAVEPDNVVVELCRSRQELESSLQSWDYACVHPNPTCSLGGAMFFGAVNQSINLGGQSALDLRLLLAVFSSKISSGVNRPFGEEVIPHGIVALHDVSEVEADGEVPDETRGTAAESRVQGLQTTSNATVRSPVGDGGEGSRRAPEVEEAHVPVLEQKASPAPSVAPAVAVAARSSPPSLVLIHPKFCRSPRPPRFLRRRRSPAVGTASVRARWAQRKGARTPDIRGGTEVEGAEWATAADAQAVCTAAPRVPGGAGWQGLGTTPQHTALFSNHRWSHTKMLV
ncbi:hypothetical protein SETIT_6G228900v2 [Setaria italica]|uniref:Uncharacterized protein n=1 Tax=Setaria italica TaxID=4555 RepID=A0A368RPD2_SETIT|nr:hypothetical protein SETIT_6G228900v2 [Setaria italica]